MLRCVLNRPPFLNITGLRIWQICEYVRVTQRVCLNKLDYALVMSQHAGICPNNAEYD